MTSIPHITSILGIFHSTYSIFHVWSPQAEIIFVLRLIQGRNNVIRVRVEFRSCDQGLRENEIKHRFLQVWTRLHRLAGVPRLPEAGPPNGDLPQENLLLARGDGNYARGDKEQVPERQREDQRREEQGVTSS